MNSNSNIKLKVGSTNELFSLDSTKVEALRNIQLLSTIYQTLIYKTERYNFQAELANRWQVNDSKDKYQFWIDESFFHDGSKVTALDVAYSIARHLWPSSNSILKNKLKNSISGSTKLDENELPSGISVEQEHNSIIFSLNHSTNDFMELLASPSLAVIQWQAFQLGQYIGSGPLMLSSLPDTELLQFDRHNDYTGARNLSPMSVKIYEDVSNLEEDVLTEKVELAIGERTASLLENDQICRTALDDPKISFLLFNGNSPIFIDAAFRHDFYLLCRNLAKQFSSMHDELHLLDAYFPAGVMNESYYQTDLPYIDTKSFVDKWYKHLNQFGFKIVITPNRGSISNFLMLLVNQLSINGYSPKQLITKTKDEVYEIIKTNSFDVVPRGWSDNIDDIDGFVQALRNRGPNSNDDEDFERAFKQMALANTILNKTQKKTAYAKAMQQLEAKHYFAPLFEEFRYLPHSKTLKINQSMLFPFDIVPTQ